MLDATAISAIETIIRRGNDAEIKLVHGSILVVEIHRKTAYKTVATG